MPLCKHVAEWKEERGGPLAYRPLQRGFLAQGGSTTQLSSSCVCLHCAAAHGSFARLQQYHSEAGQHGHVTACDTRRRELYCFACSDYIYDADFDSAMLGVSAVKLNVPDVPKKIENEPPEAKSATQQHSGKALALAPAAAIGKAHNFPYGLRGLCNLGNTCFMNSVLQAMVHAPLLRNFYLSGSHVRSQCVHSLAKPCLSCELDGIFSASYSGATQPFSPAAFLHAWWRHADHHLASYQQQDAHEFYLYALAGLGQSRMAPEEKVARALEEAPAQLQQPQQQAAQEAGVPSAAAQLPAAKEASAEDNCLLMPSAYARNASLAGPSDQEGVLGSYQPTHASSTHALLGHSNQHIPSHLTNGCSLQGQPGFAPAPSQAARLQHSRSAPGSPKQSSHEQLMACQVPQQQHQLSASSAPQQQRFQSSSIAQLACNSQMRPSMPQPTAGHIAGLCNGGARTVQLPAPQSQWMLPGMQATAGQHSSSTQQQQPQSIMQQSSSHLQPLQSSMQHSSSQVEAKQSSMKVSSASWQSHLPGVQQQQQQLQQSHSAGAQQGVPEHTQPWAPCQNGFPQPFKAGVRPGLSPHLKQEPGLGQQQSACLPQPRSPMLPQMQHGLQQTAWQHPQSLSVPAHQVPQQPSSLHALHGWVPQPGGSLAPQSMSQQPDMKQESDPEPAQNGVKQEQPQEDGLSQAAAPEAEGIVQRIFGGVLQSEVICAACCHISTAYDPFLDISLDIGAPPLPPPPMLKPPAHGAHRQSSGPKRLTGAAAMAVAAAQKRAAVSAPAEVSLGGTPESVMPMTSALPEQLPASGNLSADVADAPELARPSEAERTSPDTDVISIVGEATSQKALSEICSMERSGSQNAGDAGKSWQGTPALEEPPTRRGSTEAPVPEYRASPTEASERDFASTTRGPISSEGASSGVVGNSQDVDEAMSTPNGRIKQRPQSSGGGRGRPGSGGNKRQARCMQCPTCLRPAQKKACLRNAALRSAASLDRAPSADGVSVEVTAAEAPSQPSPSPDAASTPSKASGHRIRSEEDALGASSRSPSLTFPTRASLPQPETPHAAAVTPLPFTNGASEQQQQQHQQQQGAAAGARQKLHGTVSLLGCLQRFVRPERIGAAERWVCGGCGRPQHAVKQMSVHRLPPVLCLHVKRFEHTGVGKKLYTPLEFTAYLDMRPYLSSSVMHARLVSHGLQGRQQGKGALSVVPAQRAQQEAEADPCLYELYTVVCHRGNLQGGHYVSYVKCRDAWYLCDDSAVFQVDERTACCPSAYMLFYRQLAIQA